MTQLMERPVLQADADYAAIAAPWRARLEAALREGDLAGARPLLATETCTLLRHSDHPEKEVAD